MDSLTALILPIGTQVVTMIELRVLNETRFHPRGSVGVIRNVPTDGRHSYLIEFPDGSIASAKRQEFAIRKHFQNEPIENSIDGQDLYQFVIYRCVVGSRAFGLDDENSDTDRRGIFLPPANLHWAMYGVPEQIENKENEECYWELQKFLVLALKANPNVLECLNTPLIEFKNEIADELLTMKEVFYSKLVYQTYNGYVMSQFKKLEQDLRSIGGIRWKHAMHLIRLLLQGIEIMKSGELSIKVSQNRDKLLEIKHGTMSWETVNDWRLVLHKEFENSFSQTKLPDRPDYERVNAFLIMARRSVLSN